jgi:hypothetical protein
MTVHFVNVGEVRISREGKIYTPDSASGMTIKDALHWHSEFRVFPDPNIPNSANYPNLKDYLNAEAASGFSFAYLSQNILITGTASSGGAGPAGPAGPAASLIAPIVTTNSSVSGTTSTNAALGNLFRYTLTGSITLANPTGMTDGQLVTWELIQGGSGSYTIAFGSNFDFGTDLPTVVLSTTTGKRDFLSVRYNATTGKFYIIGFIKGF